MVGFFTALLWRFLDNVSFAASCNTVRPLYSFSPQQPGLVPSKRKEIGIHDVFLDFLRSLALSALFSKRRGSFLEFEIHNVVYTIIGFEDAAI